MKRTRGILLLALAAGLALGWSPVASACGNSVRYKESATVRLLSRANGALRHGQDQTAYAYAQAAYQELEQPRRAKKARPKKARPKKGRRGSARESRRAQHLMAIAVIRMGGLADLPKGEVKKKLGKDARDRNIRKAVATLVELKSAMSGDTYFAAHFAEAQLIDPETRATGATALQKLSESDLLPGPWSQRALALARHHAGDVGGRDRAVRRCKVLTKKKSKCDDFQAEQAAAMPPRPKSKKPAAPKPASKKKPAAKKQPKRVAHKRQRAGV